MSTPRPQPHTLLTTGAVSSEVSLLFRTKRVSQIRQIESNIRSDAEEKSHSLRLLLTTRYPDLLSAADEISTSRDAASHSVRDALRTLATSATALRTRFLHTATATPSPQAPDDLARRKTVHAIGARLNHIVDSPEVLYAHLEAASAYDAAVRYALAERNFATLRDTTGLEGVANRFAQQRWRQVEAFRPRILAVADRRLVAPAEPPHVYARAVAALRILAEGDSDLLTVVHRMLQARVQWIDAAGTAAGMDVAARLRAVARVVRETVVCMRDVFWDPEGVEALLRDVDDAAAEDLVQLRAAGRLNEVCLKWVGDVRAWLEEHGRAILIAADTSRVLADTLLAIDEVFAGEEWPEVCKVVLKEPPRFVFDIFTPFISERASSVASESVRKTVDKVFVEFDAAWEDLSAGPHAGKLIWAAISSQAVGLKVDANGVSDGKAKVSVPSATDENEAARTIACNGPVATVVNNFEATLGDALGDVTILTQRVPSVASAFDDSVQSCLPQILKWLNDKLDSIPDTFSDDNTAIDASCQALMEKALVIARTATTLSSVESIQSAYLFSDTVLGTKEGKPGLGQNIPSNSALMKFRQSAEDLACSGYQTWANRLCLRLREQLETDLTEQNVLCVPMGWVSSSGQEAQGEGASGLRHPSTASTAVVNLVLRACKAANRAGGFALPDQAMQFLRKELAQICTSCYEQAFDFYCGDALGKQGGYGSNQSNEKNSDVAIMQMLFDVQVLRELLGEDVTERENSASKRDLKGLEHRLHAAIDPIDLASCRKPMQSAVDGYSSRTSILFGTITRNSTGRSSYVKRPITMSSLQASSNLVTLSKTVSRFTYLPAPMPSTYSATSVGTAGLSVKAALGALRMEATSANGSAYRKREAETSVADYASKVSESVGRFGRGFFESFTRKVG